MWEFTINLISLITYLFKMFKYIYLDESGDLGFKDKSSKYFVITIFSCGIKEEQEL